MSEKQISFVPERLVRTITLMKEDFFLLDDIEKFVSKEGFRIKTDSKLIRTAIQFADKAFNGDVLNIKEVAEKVLGEDGRTGDCFKASPILS